MKKLLIILCFAFSACSVTNSNESKLICAEAIHDGERMKIYYPLTHIYPKDNTYKSGFYILSITNNFEIIDYKIGLINFENGIASIINGC